MNLSVKLTLALAIAATLILQGEAELGPCEKNGAFACEDAADNCDYYTCVYYPSLNKWLLTKYKCSPEGATWDDAEKRCVAPTTTTPIPTAAASGGGVEFGRW